MIGMEPEYVGSHWSNDPERSNTKSPVTDSAFFIMALIKRGTERYAEKVVELLL